MAFFLDNRPLIDRETSVRAQSLPFVDLGLDQLAELLWAVGCLLDAIRFILTLHTRVVDDRNKFFCQDLYGGRWGGCWHQHADTRPSITSIIAGASPL